jgi:predicted cupin superfamily sugar epimerase
MDIRAARLIRELDLRPHPEGGYFREVFRSRREVQPLDPRSARSALTTIYFLLVEGQCSRWHRVASDEAWHFYEGDPVDLFWVDTGEVVHRELLGSLEERARPVHVIPAGCWQAARPTGSYALVGCTVGPGFDFADFEILDETSPAREMLRRLEGVPKGIG